MREQRAEVREQKQEAASSSDAVLGTPDTAPPIHPRIGPNRRIAGSVFQAAFRNPQ